MTKKHEGICRLCGVYGSLTFEHIPPRSAFNDQPLVFRTMQNLLQGHSHTKFRKGVGTRSLCESCNNRTGAWYGEAFVNWSRQGLNWLNRLEFGDSLALPYRIRPLNVLKQIMVMVLAMGPESAVSHREELRRFVLNREHKYLPPDERVYVYFNVNGKPRFASGAAVMNVAEGVGAYIRGEVSLPPFGYCVCNLIKNRRSMPESEGLCDITWFSRFDYNVWTQVFLKLPALETHLPFPLDYRSQSEIEEQSKAQ